MVVRFWSAHTTEVKFPDYLRHFREHVLVSLYKVPGFLEARVLSQSDGVIVRFIVETLWESIEAVEQFAGPDNQAAVIADEALELLTSYDRRAIHYSVDLREDSHAVKTLT